MEPVRIFISSILLYLYSQADYRRTETDSKTTGINTLNRDLATRLSVLNLPSGGPVALRPGITSGLPLTGAMLNYFCAPEKRKRSHFPYFVEIYFYIYIFIH